VAQVDVVCLLGVLAVFPSLALMYYALKNYIRFLDENTIIFFLAGGILVGGLSYLYLVALPRDMFCYIDLTIGLYVLGFSVFETLVKFVILNYKRFVGKYETVYYGAAFGAGYGGSMLAAFISRDLMLYPEDMGDPATFISVVPLAAAFPAVNLCTGVYIGYGSYSGERRDMFLKALGVQVGFHTIMVFFWLSQVWYRIAISGVAMVYSLMVFYLYILEHLHTALPKNLRRKLRRDLKKGDAGA